MLGQAQQHHRIIANGDIVIYRSKRKVIFWLLLTLAMVVLFLPLLSNPDNWTHIERVLAALVVITSMALCAVLGIRHLVTRKYAIMINQEGISLHAGLIDCDLIPWREIERISTSQVLSQGRLQIALRNPESFIAQQDKLRLSAHWILKGNVRRSRTLIVGDGLLPISADALLEQIEHHYSKELKRHSIVINRAI